MKLYRYEVKENGEWKGIFRNSISEIRNELWYDTILEMFIELHAPRGGDYLISDIEDGKFYFKEMGVKRFEKGLELMMDVYTKAGIETKLEIINLGEVLEYQCIYQDEDQIFLKINDNKVLKKENKKILML